MSFLKPYVIFHDTTCLYFFSSGITSFWQKYPIQIFRFSTTRVKIHQIIHVIFHKKSEFFSSLDHSSVSWEISLLHIIGESFYPISKTSTSKRKFSLVTAHIKIYQIHHVIFATKSQFFFKFCITHQCPEISFFCTFSSKTLYAFDKRNPLECKFSDFQLLAWKLTKLLCHFSRHESVFL